jgi:hypothetical protein
MESLPTGLCRWPRQIAIGKAFADGKAADPVVGPVFRAENSHTHRHLDAEMEIKEHYFEVRLEY